MAHDDNLPDLRPPRQHPPFMELSFAALGWLARAAAAAGGIAFPEALQRARINLKRAAGYAGTPAEVAVVTGLTSSLQGLIEADAEARKLLEESLSEFDATFEAGCVPTEFPDGSDDSELHGHDVSQDPAA